MLQPSLFARRGAAMVPAAVAMACLAPDVVRALQASGAALGATRVAVALAAVVGVVAVQVTVARAAGRRAGAFAALVLATIPAPRLGETVLGDAAVGSTALAVAFGGLALAAFDARSTRGTRVAALGIGLGALALGGLARGAVIGVALPSFAIGLTWALSGVAVPGYADRGGAAVGAGALALGGAAIAMRASSLAGGVGRGTFDAGLGDVAYAAFPWTGLLPLALASLATNAGGAPVVTGDAAMNDRAERTTAHLRLAVVVGLAVAYAAHAALGGSGTSFAGAPLVACAVGLALDALDRAPPARGAAAVAVAITALVARDFLERPETALVALGSMALPPGLTGHVRPTSIAAAVVGGATAAAVVLAGVRARWVAGYVALGGGLVAATIMRIGVIDRIAALGSPAEVLARYARAARPGEPLGLLGVEARHAARAAVPSLTLADPEAAAAWLATPGERRFLAVSAELLPRVTARVRARSSPARTLPVLTPVDATVVLAASSLLPGEASTSPFDAVWLTAPPPNLRYVQATFGDALTCEGWTLDEGLRAGRRSRIRLVFRVRAAMADRFCTFVHVDMAPSRLTAEHRDLGGIRLSELQPGDLVADTFDLDVPLRATPGRYAIYAGVGLLPCTDDRRVAIRAGASDGHDRAPLGTVEVTR